MKARKTYILVASILVLSLLVPLTAQASLFTWTGTTSNVWNLDTNWGSSGGVFPGSAALYADQAQILVSGNNPATISTTVTLGGAATALTIGNYAPNLAAAMDIALGGTLGIQGNVSLGTLTTNDKKITIEGVLRNDTSPAATNTISGGSANNITQLVGGTISSLNGGSWAFQRPVQGYGTISAPFSNTTNGTITANVSGQTLHITGAGTLAGSIGSSLSGAILSLESTITGGTLTHTGEVDLNGATLSGMTLANTGTAAFNVTGNSTLSGTITRNTNTPFTIMATNTLNLSGCAFGNVSGGSASFAVGTGTLNNSGATTSTISNGDPITLAGGQVTNTGGGTFTISTPINGRGTVFGPLSSLNSTKAVGGTLVVDGTGGAVDVHGTTVFTDGIASSILDLKGNINFGSGGFMYSNPSGGTGNGEVRLDGATLNGTINSNLLGQGAVNVVNNSALVGTYNCSATLGINSLTQFAIAGSTLNFNVGSLNNSGTLAVGNGTMNNLTVNAYTLGGAGNITLAGGSVTSTGGGGFVSSNILSGYGNVTALYTNNAKVIANGGGIEQTLNLSSIAPVTNTGGMGWYAQNHGMLTLPSLAVNADATYNWGGIAMVNSIALTFSGTTPTAGPLAISLLSPDRVDVPAGLVDPIGVWAFNPNALAFGSASLAFRYDDALAASLALNESNLVLLGYDGTSWNVIPTNPVDTVNKLITTSPDLTSFYQDFAIALPEPMTMSTLVLGGMALLMRRRGR